MADVSPPRPRGPGDRAFRAGDDAERGQLFIVTALTLAVLFVALALFLNTAIFTENLATRSADPGVGDAVEFRAAADEGAGDLLAYVNLHSRTDATTLGDSYEAALAEWKNVSARHAVADGHRAIVSNAGVTFGGQVAQTDPDRNLTAAAATDWKADWTVVHDADEIRSFNMTLYRDGLAKQSETDSSDWFEVTGDNDNTVFSAYVADGGDGSVAGDDIVITDGSGTTMCHVTTSETTIDLVEGSVNRNDCGGFPTVADDDLVKYNNADNATGTYRLTFREPVDEVDTSPFSGTVGTSPFLTDYIWNASVDLTYSTPDVHYETEIEVDPGEDDG